MCPPAFVSMHSGVDKRIFPSSDHVPKRSVASSPGAAIPPASPFSSEFSEKKKQSRKRNFLVDFPSFLDVSLHEHQTSDLL